MKGTITLLLLAFLFGYAAQAQHWQTFNVANSGIPQDKVQAIAFDQQGLAWIGTASNSLTTFDGITWTQFDTTMLDPTCAYNISDISIDPTTNDVWVVAQNKCGILQYSRSTSSWTSHGFLFNYSPRAVEIDSAGVVWIGNSANGGLYRFRGASFEVFNETNSDNPNDYVFALGIVNNTERWVTGTHGVGLMNDSSGWSVFPPDSFWGSPSFLIMGDVEIENDSITWFSHTKGIASYNRNQNLWTSYSEQNTPLPPLDGCHIHVRAMAIDSFGNKWIASCEGLAKFDGTQWEIFNTNNSPIPSNQITSIEIDSRQRVWIGTRLHGLVIFDPNSATGLDDLAQGQQVEFTFYPNPTSDQITFSCDTEHTYRLEIYDLKGSLVIAENGVKNGSRIPVSLLSSGMYNLVVKRPGYARHEKLFID